MKQEFLTSSVVKPEDGFEYKKAYEGFSSFNIKKRS